MRKRIILPTLVMLILFLGIVGQISAQGDGIVRLVYFYRDDCPHCLTVLNEVLRPMQDEYGDRLQIKLVQFHDASRPAGEGDVYPDKYEMLIRAEELLHIQKRDIPVLVIDGQALIGEEEIRQQLPCLIGTCLAEKGTAWPDIPGLETIPVGWEIAPAPQSTPPPLLSLPTITTTACSTATFTCESGPPPLWMAYFYQVGCQECSRAESDIQYIRNKYPQLTIDEFNIYESTSLALARALAQRAGREDVHTPALFIGDDALIGEEEINPRTLEQLLEKYAPTGAGRVWEELELNSGGATQLYPTVGPLQVAVGGLLDGLNPCAFATLIFFISYLTVNERRGWEILAVGAAFSIGVFVTYLLIGLGLYRLIDAMRTQYAVVSHWAYILTALLCGVLGFFSLLDYFKARRGQLEDMALVMPAGLKKRVRAVIRRTSGARAFAPMAFMTGMVVSFLELACTGQIYLATLVSMVSTADTRGQALPLLLLYNLMFILPLVVVFVLVYYGTSSVQLGVFLRRHTATVKLGTAILFISLGTWLVFSLVA